MLLKQQMGVQEFWEPLLLPWRHYVPLASDLSNLTDGVRWVREQPERARAMAAAAAELVETALSEAGLAAYTLALVRGYAQLYRGPLPALPPRTSVRFECDVGGDQQLSCHFVELTSRRPRRAQRLTSLL